MVQSGIAAGAGNHLPIGDYGSADYRSAMRFPLPSGFAGWTTITKATLNFYISDFDHVGPRNSGIHIRRMSVAGGLWTQGAGYAELRVGLQLRATTPSTATSRRVSTDQVYVQFGHHGQRQEVGRRHRHRPRLPRAPARRKLVFVFDNVGLG